MKLLPLASLTLVAALLLTGCASTPTLEDQTKLVEYEMCLEESLSRLNRLIDTRTMKTSSTDWTDFYYAELGGIYKMLKECKEYRP